MGVLPRLFKLWPWIDLDLFYIKVKFGYIGFCMGESVFCFFGNYCSLQHSAKWVNEVERGSEVKVILWTWPKVIQISKLNVWLWPVYSGERFRASWPSCFSLRKQSHNSRFILKDGSRILGLLWRMMTHIKVELHKTDKGIWSHSSGGGEVEWGLS